MLLRRDWWEGMPKQMSDRASIPIWKAVGWALVASLLILLIAYLISTAFTRNSGELSGWVQATGTVMAIVGGIVGVLYQVEVQRQAKVADIAAIGRAAEALAASAYTLVTDRLNSAIQPGKTNGAYSLRGVRTTEMVGSMREFEVGLLPTRLVTPFVTLRSCVQAINARIETLYADEDRAHGPALARLKATRSEALESAVRVHVAAAKAYEELNTAAAQECRASTRAIPVPMPLKARRDAVKPEVLIAGSLHS